MVSIKFSHSNLFNFEVLFLHKRKVAFFSVGLSDKFLNQLMKFADILSGGFFCFLQINNVIATA